MGAKLIWIFRGPDRLREILSRSCECSQVQVPPPPHVAVVQSTGETPHFTELVPAVCTVLVPLMAEDWTTDMLCDSLEPCKGLCLRIFKHFEIYCLQWNLYLH